MDDMEYKSRMVGKLVEMLQKSSANEMHKDLHPEAAAPVNTPPVDLGAKNEKGYEDTSHSDALCKKCGESVKMCNGGAMAEGGIVSPEAKEGANDGLCDKCKGVPVVEIDIEEEPEEEIPAIAQLRRRK